MTQKFGPDRLLEQCLEHVAAYVTMVNDHFSRPPYNKDSPIENLLQNALHFHLKYAEQEWFERLQYAQNDEALEKAKALPDYRKIIIVQPQVQLPDWRVDHLMHAYADWAREPSGGVEGWRRLIVECDGHDFHERTKEQAAKDRSRDRWAQANGYDIFRFTGSEIWRDPMGCAGQIVEWANRGV